MALEGVGAHAGHRVPAKLRPLRVGQVADHEAQVVADRVLNPQAQTLVREARGSPLEQPRCRVRPLRASAAKRLEGCVLRHPRHSHVAFLVGKGHGRGAASAALGGAKLAMVEEGLFAHEESGVPRQEHAHVSSIAEP